MALSLPGVIIILVLFLGLLFVFTPLLYRPYLRILDEREALETGIGHEDEAHPELDAMEAQVMTALQAAEDEVRSANAEARARAIAASNEEIGELRQRLATEAGEHREQLQAQTEAARQSLRQEAEAMAGEIGHRVLGRTL
ncbi:MAG: hypothetical protein CMH55_00075 [Myxococcales bacterium]|nr:hypothetical protein [Myxococcales bacterium]